MRVAQDGQTLHCAALKGKRLVHSLQWSMTQLSGSQDYSFSIGRELRVWIVQPLNFIDQETEAK